MIEEKKLIERMERLKRKLDGSYFYNIRVIHQQIDEAIKPLLTCEVLK